MQHHTQFFRPCLFFWRFPGIQPLNLQAALNALLSEHNRHPVSCLVRDAGVSRIRLPLSLLLRTHTGARAMGLLSNDSPTEGSPTTFCSTCFPQATKGAAGGGQEQNRSPEQRRQPGAGLQKGWLNVGHALNCGREWRETGQQCRSATSRHTSRYSGCKSGEGLAVPIQKGNRCGGKASWYPGDADRGLNTGGPDSSWKPRVDGSGDS